MLPGSESPLTAPPPNVPYLFRETMPCDRAPLHTCAAAADQDHASLPFLAGRDHAARRLWHERLTPFTRSHRSRATRSRLPCLPRPALSLRGWRQGAGQLPAAHTRRLLPAPRSTADRRGATNTKDEALLRGCGNWAPIAPPRPQPARQYAEPPGPPWRTLLAYQAR
eukprot:COSAG01_NODE_27237_length_690_cov_3.994924_2_plen_166_part_01